MNQPSVQPNPPNEFWRAKDGPLTQDLIQEPGKFGLGKVPKKLKPNATTTMVCGFCSTGCGLNIHLLDGEGINLTPSSDYPVNVGMACPKGWEALSVLNSPDRATTPLVRHDDGELRPTDWHTAMSLFCERFKSIQEEHGPDSLAFLSTGQMPTEEMVYLGSLAKFGMGMIHGDGNTRQCMATAAVAYKQSFGFDAPPYTYQDFEESDVLVLVGSNLCIAHPIMWQRVLANRNQPEIIVVDPRQTETAMAATQHLPLRPKSDLALFYGIAHILNANGWIDRPFIDAHTTGFEDFQQHLAAFTPEVVAEATGISVEQLQQFAERIHHGKRVSFWWTMGVNQSYEGVRTAQAIINLALMTGNIGRPGTGANSITGQCNAMGSRVFSNTTSLLGGRKFTEAQHRQEVARILSIDEQVIPTRDSWAYPEIIEGIRQGKIKGLWVVCTNTAHSWIGQDECREILDQLDFLVVQDMYHSTDTAKCADLVLPAAGWGEKEGTFINSERRLGLIKKVRRAPGQALSDLSIFRLIAQYWGCSEMFNKWNSAHDVFQSIKELSRGQPCDITGIRDYQMLDECGGIQWPYPQSQETEATSAPPEQQRRLFANGRFYHPDGLARFLFENPRPMPEAPDEEYPYLLLTGRATAAQWHTETRTSKSAVLRKLGPQHLHVEIHPDDAQRQDIVAGEEVIVESRRATVRAKALLSPSVNRGQVFMAMHNDQTNRLTLPHFDPYSRQPSYKDCAVRIRRPSRS